MSMSTKSPMSGLRDTLISTARSIRQRPAATCPARGLGRGLVLLGHEWEIAAGNLLRPAPIPEATEGVLQRPRPPPLRGAAGRCPARVRRQRRSSGCGPVAFGNEDTDGAVEEAETASQAAAPHLSDGVPAEEVF